MAEERDFELLDDYLTNRLNPTDKAYFENRLKQDPDLQREYTIQQNIAEGLRAARKAELKAMLNAVPIPGGGTSLVTKLVGVGTVALIIGVGVYLYNDKTTPATEEKSLPPVSATDDKTVEQNNAMVNEPTPSNETSNTATPAPSTPTTVKPAPGTTKSKPETSRVPEVYDPSADIEEGGDNTEQTESQNGEAEVPKSEIASKVESGTRYKFHYQFIGDLVTLYGPFDKNLYTIMDFNDVSTGKRSVFLFYKNTYYLLNENNAVKPLSPVNDPALLKKLRESK